jgi:hypothetical protein
MVTPARARRGCRVARDDRASPRARWNRSHGRFGRWTQSIWPASSSCASAGRTSGWQRTTRDEQRRQRQWGSCCAISIPAASDMLTRPPPAARRVHAARTTCSSRRPPSPRNGRCLLAIRLISRVSRRSSRSSPSDRSPLSAGKLAATPSPEATCPSKMRRRREPLQPVRKHESPRDTKRRDTRAPGYSISTHRDDVSRGALDRVPSRQRSTRRAHAGSRGSFPKLPDGVPLTFTFPHEVPMAAPVLGANPAWENPVKSVIGTPSREPRGGTL